MTFAPEIDRQRWSLYYHTARNMQLRQLAGIAERTLRHAIVPRLPVDFDRRYEQEIPNSPAVDLDPIRRNNETLRSALHESTRDENRRRVREAADGRFTFLDRSLDLSPDAPSKQAPTPAAASASGTDAATSASLGVETSAHLGTETDALPRPERNTRFESQTNTRSESQTNTRFESQTSLRTRVEPTERTGTAVPEIRWEHPDLESYPLLWRLHLHAFPQFRWRTLGFEAHESASDLDAAFVDWIDDWIETHPVDAPNYLRRTWIPHSVSLRLLHLSRYAGWLDGAIDDDRERTLYRAAYKNALFLSNHVEWDVGGNHLIENGAALVVAGILFEDDPGWVEQGCSVLVDAADTQFLDDGGHFERSPMYHLQCLERYLTAIGCLREAGRSVPEPLERTATRATDFADALEPPDGTIPLLNDSVYGETLRLDECLGYADRLGLRRSRAERPHSWGSPRRSPVSGRTRHPPLDSGYVWLGGDDDRLLVDAGPVGPPHLPGHSHNDHLQLLLWVDGTPVFSDTGTYGYAASDRRSGARSVAGHNTVQVGEIEPIEIGGSYLMGRRTAPSGRVIRGEIDLFEGAYERRSRLGETYRHERTVHAGDGWWLVWDRVDSDGSPSLTSRLHCHPDVEVTGHGDALSVRSRTGDRELLSVVPVGAADVAITESPYYPRFGVERSRPSIELTVDDPTPFGYLLSTEPFPDARVAIDRGRPRRLLLDRAYSLPTPESDPVDSP